MLPTISTRMGVRLATVVAVLALSAAPVAAQTEPDAPAPDDATAEPQVEQPARADLTEVNELVRSGAYGDAAERLALLHEEFPEDERIPLMRGELLLATGRPDDALPLLRQAAEADPERTRVHFQLATALDATGESEAALDAYAREIEVNDDVQVQVMARINRALLLQRASRWADAASEFEAAAGLDPARAEVYGDAASNYLQAGRLQDAARALEAGDQAGFRSAKHYLVLGTKLHENESLAPAIAALEQALEIDPALADAERALAAALDQAGRQQEALAHLRRYLELKPGAPDAQKVTEWIRSIEGP